MGSGMPDYGFSRCDGHHEMVDFRLEKNSGIAWAIEARMFSSITL